MCGLCDFFGVIYGLCDFFFLRVVYGCVCGVFSELGVCGGDTVRRVVECVVGGRRVCAEGVWGEERGV